jgi:RNA methyltransferase, TrmH family
MGPQIISPANPRIRRLVRLKGRKHRDESRVFVVEGHREVERAIEAGMTAREIYRPARRSEGLTAEVVFICSPEALAKASYRSSPDAVIAVFDQFDTSLSSLRVGDAPFILIAEGLEKPGNLGAILRTADAAGADGVIAVDSRIDPFNPNVIRASTGAIFTVPMARAPLAETVVWTRARHLLLVAASPAGDLAPWDVDLTGPLALLVGSEDAGLSRAAIEHSDRLTRIPMSGSVDSLNTSVSMGMLAYETVRQRSR